jgi:cytochrome c2
MRKPTTLVLVVLCLLLASCSGGGNQGAPSGGQGSGAAGNASNGDKLFHQTSIGSSNAPGCATCHSTEAGKTLVGPSLAHIGTDAGNIIKGSDYKGKAKTAEDYIHESIVDPNAYVVKGFTPGIMYQNYGKDLQAQDINDLVAYLMTLK